MLTQTLYCPWEPATYLFFSSNVPPLIHYSHFSVIFSALVVGLIIYFNNPKSLLSRLFLFFSTLFCVWSLLDIILWATNDPSMVMFSWSIQVLIEPLTFALAFYLFYLYLYNKLPGFIINLTSFIVLLPLILFLPTALNLESLQLSTCESIEGVIAKYYSYTANIIFILATVAIGFIRIPALESQDRKRTAILFGIGLVTFLLSFTSGNIISSFTDDWTISQYGLFGMPVFATLIIYSIVRFNAFSIQVIGAQALIVSLWALVGSLLFLVNASSSRIVVGLTLGFTTIVGFFLIRSIRKEVAQRKQIEKLAANLERANVRLKALDKQKSEFVSIASHQLRSPLTAIRGYASLLLEGSFGNLPQKAKEPLTRIDESSKLMAFAIEDYLNVSRIESGNMKYTLTDFNLPKEVEHITDDLRADALKQGLVLYFKKSLNSQGVIHADVGKTIQIVHNLINNAIKYTPKGSITVLVRDDMNKKKIFVDIIDTGIGMDTETLHTIFQKFERAKNANTVNPTGTGLGLFVADKMAEAMGGDITADSDGDGKGSRFTLEMPLAM